MEKKLVKDNVKTWYFVNDEKIDGIPSWISGIVTGIFGNVSGIFGNVSGISGNIDTCKITNEERKNGVNILDLCK